METVIKIGLVDDHQLFIKSLDLMISSLEGFRVVLTASDGLMLQQRIKEAQELPDLILVDVDMPRMNGIETTHWLRIYYPEIKPIALSMSNHETVIIKMIKEGCKTYLLKDTHPAELERALRAVYAHGFYNADLKDKSLNKLLASEQYNPIEELTGRELDFLKLAASDNTYRQIATSMNLSERTIDGYRESLFSKFQVQSRTGMVLEAIRRGLVKV
jgi:DNA-binding NarL/FixJ family response regulator